tara:strand:+ start:182 stop:958 length:777 start_codon:yes stop_codon:yes gene_type:complete
MNSNPPKEGRLEGKVALVTGASSGIGQSCVARFIEEGARVVASDIATGDMRGYSNDSVVTFEGDVTSNSDSEAMVEMALSAFGGLHIVVNSAGVSGRNALPETDDPESIWDRVVEVNLKGTYLVSWHSVPVIRRSGGGSIVNLASIMGLVGYPPGLGGGFNAYPPSKGGVVLFTKTLANDLANKGIRVNCLCPGYVETSLTESLTSDADTNEYLKNLHPMGRLGRPEEIANAALFLASDEASFITGSSLVIDGGYTAQ